MTDGQSKKDASKAQQIIRLAIYAGCTLAIVAQTFGISSTLCYTQDKVDEYQLSNTIDIITDISYDEQTSGTGVKDQEQAADGTVETGEIQQAAEFVDTPISIYESNSKIRLNNGTFSVASIPQDDGESQKYVYIDVNFKDTDENLSYYTVEYDQTQSGLMINDNIIIDVHERTSDESSKIVLGNDDGSAVAFVKVEISDKYELDIMGLCGQTEEAANMLDSLCEIAQQVRLSDNKQTQIQICGMACNNFTDIQITDDVIQVSYDEDTFYLSPYESSLTGQGLQSTKEIQGNVFKYGNIYDSATGYRPVILKQDAGNLKFSVKAVDNLDIIFTAEQ